MLPLILKNIDVSFVKHKRNNGIIQKTKAVINNETFTLYFKQVFLKSFDLSM